MEWCDHNKGWHHEGGNLVCDECREVLNGVKPERKRPYPPTPPRPEMAYGQLHLGQFVRKEENAL